MLVLLVAALPMPAQDNETCSGPTSFNVWYGVNGEVGVPFSATTKNTFEQTLADGNHLHSETRAFQARDSAGRTRTEEVEECEVGEDGQLHPRVRVQINDPTTRSHLMWETGEGTQKVVQVSHYPEARKMTPEELAESQRQIKLSALRRKIENDTRTQENLGTRTLNGVPAHGTRLTQVIPAGVEGNDQPLTTVNETWMSSDLDLTIMATTEDPRRGKTTFEYESLTRGEPDPALFKAPEGYKAVELQTFQ